MFFSCNFLLKDTLIYLTGFFSRLGYLMNVARNGLPLPKAYVNVFFLLGIYRLYLKDVLYYNEMIS